MAILQKFLLINTKEIQNKKTSDNPRLFAVYDLGEHL